MTYDRDRRRPSKPIWLVAVAAAVGFGGCQHERPLERFRYEQRHLGTYVRLVFYAPSEAVANRAAEATYKKVAELDAVFSNYRLDSEIMRLCDHANWGNDAASPVEVSPDLWTVLTTAGQISRQTNGAFDVTVGPLTRLWKRAIKDQSLPDQARINKAREERVGYEYIELVNNDGHGGTNRGVRLLRPKMRIDVGAIAKGYIADELLKELARFEIDRALIDIGGDLALGDPPPDREGWTVSVQTTLSGLGGKPSGAKAVEQESKGESTTEPASTTVARVAIADSATGPRELVLANCGVATSGDTFQRLEIDGQVYSHILDGRTGIGVTHRTNVTTVAPNAMLADALASSLSILNHDEGRKLIREYRQSAAMLIDLDEPNPAARVTILGEPGYFGE